MEHEHRPSPTDVESDETAADAEEEDREWLSLPEAERAAYRTKALAYMAKTMRATMDNAEGMEAGKGAAWRSRNQLLFRGEAAGTPSKGDYEAATQALQGIESSSGKLWERLEDFLASAQLDLMARQMMRRDQRKELG